MSSRLQKTFPALGRWKLAALVFLISTVVFLLLYAAQFITPKHPVFKTAVQSFAALLLTSGIVSVLFNFLVRRELGEFWLKAIGLRDSVSEAGLYDIGLDFYAYDFHGLIQQASKIDLYVIHAEKWIGPRRNDFMEFLSHKNHELRVCLLDGDAPCVPMLESDFKYKDGDMSKKICDSTAMLQSCIEELEAAGQSTARVQVWKQQRVPKYSYYRFDDLLFFVPYNLAMGHPKMPVIGFIRKEGGVSDFLVNDFEKVLTDHATQIYDSRAKQGQESGSPKAAEAEQAASQHAGKNVPEHAVARESGAE